MGTTGQRPGTTGRRWGRVRALFEAACERPEGQREAWLEAECGDDEALLAEVRSLLAADGRAGELEPLTVARQGLRGVDAADRAGMRVGPYELVRLIGTGGMGAVYEARRADEAFQKTVAVKLIKRGMDTDDILRRFTTERQVLAGLEHPGVARLLDGGSTEDGLPFLVMEFVDGTALDRWCDERRLDVRERIALFRKVCEAVDFAHRRGVVHRDLKPANVLVTAEGEPKLLDFGIAKIVDTTASASTLDLTATELRLMTPEYASPEQVRGEPVGPPSDVYSLGVTLYELLTGRHPHPATTRLRMDLERAICDEEPPAPSTAVIRPPTGGKGGRPSEASTEELSRRRGRTARALRRELAGDVDTIALKALRKEPERRYATAGELADDLGRMLAGLPVQARPDTWRYRAGKLARRNKGLVISTLAVMAVLLVASVVSTTLFLKAERARQESVEREYVARMASAAAALENLDVNRARRDLELAPESERGWEWRHLAARLDRSDETLTDLGRGVILRSVAFDAEGRWMAVSGEHGRVHLFDRSGGSEVATKELSGVLKCLTFLDGGTRLALVREGGAAHLLAVPSLEVLTTHSPEGAGYWGLASPASREWLACTRSDGRVDILDPVTLEVRRSLDLQTPEENIAVSPRGALLACGGSGRELALCDAVRGELVIGPLRVGDVVSSLAFSHDGSLLAVTLATESRVATLLLVDVASGEVLERAPAHLEAIRKVLFLPGDGRVATGSLDGTIRVWSVPGLEPLQVLLGHGSAISDLALDPIQGRLASVDADGRTKVWDWDADAVRHWTGDPGWNMGLDVSPDSRRVVVQGRVRTEEGQRATIAVHDLATRAEVWAAVLEQAGESSASFSPDGSRIAVATLDGLIEIRDAATGELLLSAPAGGGGSSAGGNVRSLVWSPGGRSVISAGPGSSGWIHDVATLEPVTRLDSHHRSIWTVAVDPLGERILTGGSGSPVVDVWSAGTGLLLDSLEGHTDGALCSAFHPAGELAATGSADHTIRLWRVADATALALLEGHTARVMDLDFSPDGSRLASCGYDRTVRLWSIPDGREVATLRGHRGFVRHVRFAPDGSFLASIASDGEVRIWDAQPVDSPD